MSVTMQATPGGLAVNFPYDPELVTALKDHVPASARRWDNSRKLWLIEAGYGQKVADLVYTMTGQRVAVPAPTPMFRGVPTIETRLLTVEYIGRTKQQRAGLADALASAFVDGDWSVRFTETALRDWCDFGPGDPTNGTPRRANTFFAALGVPEDADDATIKAGYRRMAKLCHPDVDREDGAADRFRAVQRAYDTLSDPLKRRKYLAGLAFERAAASPQLSHASYATARDDGIYGYRSPLRCGHILAQGTPRLGRFEVSKILAWQPITNALGQELVTSWPAGATSFERIWI